MVEKFSDIRLIVGLGNPGQEYENTRHNLGFLTIRRLAKKLNVDFFSTSLPRGAIAEACLGQNTVYLFLPFTYMNHSGKAVKMVFEKKSCPLENLLIVCDDFALDFGQMRLKTKGSSAGHNGLNSIIQHLHTENFPRLRLGIGPSPKNKDIINFVLSEFNPRERRQLDDFIEKASECCILWGQGEIKKAMEIYNRRF